MAHAIVAVESSGGMKKTLLLVAGLVIALLAVWLVRSQSPGANGPRPAGRILDLSFTDYAGKRVALKDFLGRPLVVNSWAAWCPFCRQELRDFAAVQAEFGDKVVIVAIDRAESLATSKKYSDELGVTDKLILLLDPGNTFYQAMGGFSMPETIFVDAQGATVFHKRGPMDIEEIRQRVVSLIK